MTGADLIAKERARQIADEGWSPSHDDEHFNPRAGKFPGELHPLVAAALHYAAFPTELFTSSMVDGPSFERVVAFGDHGAPKNKKQIRRLVIAGALIAAEIDRLLRAATPHGVEALEVAAELPASQLPTSTWRCYSCGSHAWKKDPKAPRKVSCFKCGGAFGPDEPTPCSKAIAGTTCGAPSKGTSDRCERHPRCGKPVPLSSSMKPVSLEVAALCLLEPNHDGECAFAVASDPTATTTPGVVPPVTPDVTRSK